MPNSEPPGEPTHAPKETFLQELWLDTRELILHTIKFSLVLLVLSGFSFVIPRLPISEANQQTLKNLDLALIYILLVIYSIVFLYKIIEGILDRNPRLRSVGRWLMTLGNNATNEAAPNSVRSRFAVLDPVSNALIIVAAALTAFFAISSADYRFGFSLPVVLFVKGIILMADLPTELIYRALFSLLCLIVGSSIVFANLHFKKHFHFSSWIPAIGLLGLGIGGAVGARLTSTRRTRRRQQAGKKERNDGQP